MTQKSATAQVPQPRRNVLQILGFTPLQIGLWIAGMVVAFVMTLAWDQLLVERISSLSTNNGQIYNKYFLTLVMFILAAVWAVLSLLLGRRNDVAAGPGNHQRLGAVLVAFGTALMLLGSAIIPIGLYYHNIPTRSVPVGFAYFTTVFIGLFVAGVGGNMRAPRRP
ncbi:MAG: hypothetical protein NVS4B8_01660 [Herpetosiphon sp.]